MNRESRSESDAVSEDFERREEVVPLSRAVVELEGDLGASGLSQVFHGRALRDVLANEAVRVLVGSALPGVIGRGEKERGAGGSFDIAVSVKLGSVVDGDGLEQMLMRADELDDPAVRGRDRASA